MSIRERVTGAAILGHLKARTDARLRVFLLGGAGDLAAQVGAKLNVERCGLECVGTLNPRIGSIEELSSPNSIESINRSGADLLAVFLNAEKAQAWLLQNHARLTVPICAQFGATISFEARTVKRAPDSFAAPVSTGSGGLRRNSTFGADTGAMGDRSWCLDAYCRSLSKPVSAGPEQISSSMRMKMTKA
jgi:hypothetical protein